MTALDRPLRSVILAAAGNAAIQRAVSRYGMRLGARRFVAGETAAEFLAAAKRLNARGFAVAGGLLGEGVHHAAEASAAADVYCDLLRSCARNGYDANAAFKPTHVGLAIDLELALENASRIAAAAAESGTAVRLDMEQSAYVDRTLELYRRLRARFDNVGFALQSCLHRSAADLDAILPLEPNVRLVKGAYLEPAAIAFARKSDVDAAYLRLAEAALGRPGYTAIATHDLRIIEAVKAIARRKDLPLQGRFEFQMLYGISGTPAERLLEQGYRVRIAVPFGTHWFPYLMRRLAERPANLAFVVQGALGRS